MQVTIADKFNASLEKLAKADTKSEMAKAWREIEQVISEFNFQARASKQETARCIDQRLVDKACEKLSEVVGESAAAKIEALHKCKDAGEHRSSVNRRDGWDLDETSGAMKRPGSYLKLVEAQAEQRKWGNPKWRKSAGRE